MSDINSQNKVRFACNSLSGECKFRTKNNYYGWHCDDPVQFMIGKERCNSRGGLIDTGEPKETPPETAFICNSAHTLCRFKTKNEQHGNICADETQTLLPEDERCSCLGDYVSLNAVVRVVAGQLGVLKNKPEAIKHDDGKLRYDLIPPSPLEEVARLYTTGAKLYGVRNWEKGMAWGRCFAAMMRHGWAYWRGETHCPKDGQHHLSSVVFWCFALMTYEKTHKELDDRTKD